MNSSAAKTELLGRIGIYCEFIVSADDLSIAEQIWAVTPESTFIHPRGHEFGWEQIKQNFYGKTMTESCSERQLKLEGEPLIHIHDNAAIAEFAWDFTATMRDDGSAKYTTGRESQVYINMPGQGWRLVHVHYSSPPTTARGDGF